MADWLVPLQLQKSNLKQAVNLNSSSYLIDLCSTLFFSDGFFTMFLKKFLNF